MKDDRQILLRNSILQKQAGNVSGTLSHYIREDAKEAKKGLLLHLGTDLGDLLLQAMMLCRDVDIDPWQMLGLAYKRYDEGKESWRLKGKADKWI